MTTQFRMAYYCGHCWRELSRLPLHGCDCGGTDMVKRQVPVVRSPFRTGLEPIFALWGEGFRALRRRSLAIRLRQFDPMAPEVPTLRMKLAELEELPRGRG